MLKTITISIEKAQFPDIAARRESEETCYREKGRTYKDICNFCKPRLTVSLLGRLNGCSDKEVVNRDTYVDHTRAQAFAGRQSSVMAIKRWNARYYRGSLSLQCSAGDLV